ncbi:MAG: PAS domain-containing protein [Anaerolineae bacterium]|nr:PAS domain-containing protein [Anaerolineae bacterium]
MPKGRAGSSNRADDNRLPWDLLGELLFDSPAHLAALFNAADRMLRHSRGLAEWSVFPQPDASGIALEALFPAEQAAEFALRLDEARKTGHPQRVKTGWLPGLRANLHFEWSMRSVPGANGWVLATAERTLQEVPPVGPSAISLSQDLLIQVMQTTPNLLYVVDLAERRTLFINRNPVEMLGYPPGKYDGDFFAFFERNLHPDDQRPALEHRRKLADMADGSVHELEFRVLDGAGNWRWVLSRDTPFKRGPDGRVTQVLGIAQDISQRRAAEDFQVRLTEIIESTPDVVATFRADLKLTYLNWAGRDLLGLHTDHPARYDLQHFGPAWAIELIQREAIPAALRIGFWTGEAALLAADGSEVPVSLVVLAHPSSSAEVEYLSLVARDIREMRRMQRELSRSRDELERRVYERTEELRRSEALYRSLAEAAPDLVVVIARDGNVEYANQVALRAFGVSLDQMIGRNMSQIFPPEITASQQAGVDEVFATGQSQLFEIHSPRPDGDSWHDTILVPIHDEDGAITGVLVVARDVTQRKMMEDELHKSRQLLQLVLDNIPQRVFWKDLSRKFLGANQPFLTDMGLASLQDLVGRTDAELLSKEFADWYDASDRQVLESGQPILGFEEPQARLDGGTNWLRSSKMPLRDLEGRIFGVLGTYEDITEIRAARDQLAEKNLELVRSNAELAQFAYIASHDLQEPLRMVSSYAQLLQRRYQGTLDERGEKYLGYIVDGAGRMGQLILDLLTYSRVGTRGLNLHPVDTRQAVARALFNLQVAIKEAGAQVRVGELPTIHGDETQLMQLFQNLIGNAIKFRRAEAPLVEISAQRDGELWRFAVRDNGIGIDEQYFDRIFEVFSRLHGREDYAGTGIGLAVCKKIVVRHGGKIWVESKQGEGSMFFFTLPALAEAANGDERA